MAEGFIDLSESSLRVLQHHADYGKREGPAKLFFVRPHHLLDAPAASDIERGQPEAYDASILVVDVIWIKLHHHGDAVAAMTFLGEGPGVPDLAVPISNCKTPYRTPGDLRGFSPQQIAGGAIGANHDAVCIQLEIRNGRIFEQAAKDVELAQDTRGVNRQGNVAHCNRGIGEAHITRRDH